jgi:hypothetical protein
MENILCPEFLFEAFASCDFRTQTLAFFVDGGGRETPVDHASGKFPVSPAFLLIFFFP